MGASVEARVPFLDYRIVEFANSLPVDARIKGFNTKMLVKQVAEDYLPKEVIYRRKSGFGVPLAERFRSGQALNKIGREMIEKADYTDYLDPQKVKLMYQQHQDGSHDHAEFLWTTLNFLLWVQRYGL